MITKIGIVSGEILSLLERVKRPVCADELQFHLDESAEVVLMSLGYLVRAGLTHIEKRDPGYVVYLISDSACRPSETPVCEKFPA